MFSCWSFASNERIIRKCTSWKSFLKAVPICFSGWCNILSSNPKQSHHAFYWAHASWAATAKCYPTFFLRFLRPIGQPPIATPSVPNYRTSQEFWRVKIISSLIKIIERNIKIYDIKLMYYETITNKESNGT